MRILVTGASGFVGSLLVPRLLRDGHVVRALGRSPARVSAALALKPPHSDAARVGVLPGDAPPGPRPAPQLKGLEVVRGDALTGEGLAEALEGIEVAYYLIHSMERPRAFPLPPDASSQTAWPSDRSRAGRASAGPFTERERLAADSFAAAAARAGVRRIVYLGGLLPRAGELGPGQGGTGPASRHLASRAEVERILLGAVPGSVALRASIVIGARSRSFRLLVHLVERLPVLTLPAWRRFHTQPIDARDVIEMLVAAASAPVAGRSLDVGGPDVLTYGEMLTRIADLMLVNRPSLGLPLSVTPVAARVAAALAGEDPELVLPLMEGLQGDLLPADDHAAELLGVVLHTFDAAVEHALREWEASEPLAAR